MKYILACLGVTPRPPRGWGLPVPPARPCQDKCPCELRETTPLPSTPSPRGASGHCTGWQGWSLEAMHPSPGRAAPSMPCSGQHLPSARNWPPVPVTAFNGLVNEASLTGLRPAPPTGWLPRQPLPGSPPAGAVCVFSVEKPHTRPLGGPQAHRAFPTPCRVFSFWSRPRSLLRGAAWELRLPHVRPCPRSGFSPPSAADPGT